MSSVLWVKRSDWLHAIAAVGTAHLVCLSVVLLCTESLGNALLSALMAHAMLLSRLAVLCIDRMMICQCDNIGHCDLSFDLHSFPGCCRKLSQVLLQGL